MAQYYYGTVLLWHSIGMLWHSTLLLLWCIITGIMVQYYFRIRSGAGSGKFAGPVRKFAGPVPLASYLA